MQDDIVNAVYDLCEDSSVEVSAAPPVHYCLRRPTVMGQVRVEGYKAIAAASREDGGILKRNVDVLVQLLQCGEHKPLFPGHRKPFTSKKQMTRRRSSTSNKDWTSI
jgi:hypothetical protein